MADDTPAGKLAAAREMVQKSGKKASTENLNRASLAISRNEETSDFVDEIAESAAQGKPRPTRVNQNKPTTTARGGDQTVTPTKDNKVNGDPPGVPVADTASTRRIQSAGDATTYDPMGNVTQPAVATSSTRAPASIEQYVDEMIANEQAGQNAMAGSGTAQAAAVPDKAQPGSVAPVQQNPAVTPEAANADPAVATAAQQPDRNSFEQYLLDNGIMLPNGYLNMNSPAARDGSPAGMADTGMRAPRFPLARPPQFNGAPSPTLPPGSVNPPGLPAPPPQGALPSSFGPPIPRGNLNTAPPQGPINVPMGGSNAIPMGTPRPIGQPRIGTDVGNVGRMQDTAQQRLSAILRSRNAQAAR